MTVKVAQGKFLHLDPREKFDGLKTIINGLNPREPLTNLALQILRAGDNILDIGANVGYFSALSAAAVGESGKVYAFEASPSTYQRLQTLAQSNPHKNINTFELAVSNESGSLVFHCGPPDHTGTASLRDLGNRTSSTVTVRSVTIDELLDSFPTIRLVKVDVEGAEARVAQGMLRLIERDQPYILTEVTDSSLRALNSSKDELIEIYKDLGYSPFRVDRNVEPYTERVEYQCDVLLVPKNSSPFTFNESLVKWVRW